MRTRIAAALFMLLCVRPVFGAATITIVNVNATGVGFNDPTPATPVGGNPGTTVGEQRLIAFQHAANIWGAALDSSIEIRIQASFVPLTCTATAGTLGSAGAIQIISDFPGAEYPNVWYHVALANKLSQDDQAPGAPNTSADDIRARFNSELGKPGCLQNSAWYYGLDTGHSPTQINLVAVLLHEFAHGLGFSSFTSVTTGEPFFGQSDVYSQFYKDNTTGLMRDQMTDAERLASGTNPRNVVWTGANVTNKVPQVLQVGTPLLVVNAPSSIAGDYAVGAAAFGAAITAAGVSGDIVAALDAADAVGPSTTDGCSAITNGSAVAGKIALVDRGTCGFTVKVKNAQDAGAVAVIVADNAAGGPPAGLGGADPTITIPSARITLADGNTIKAALSTGTVNVSLKLDLTVRAGADRSNQVMLYTPSPVAPGSSVSHWDTSTTPNQLMEPAINQDLTLTVDAPKDLTRAQLRDIGWFPDADLDGIADDAGDMCLASTLSSTVVIGGRDTGVANTLFSNGCTITDLASVCKATGGNHGSYVSCGAKLTNTLRDLGFISGSDKGAIQSAIARDK
ncbi:MAG: PA domain-containing protein [Vicinamibacterales bacterium]